MYNTYMDCLPLEDICKLKQEMVVENHSIQATLIGNFNGRTYTFADVDGVPIIYIEKGDKDPAPDILGGK